MPKRVTSDAAALIASKYHAWKTAASVAKRTVTLVPRTPRQCTWVNVFGIVIAMMVSCAAAEYRIDSQTTFDSLRTKSFQPGDVIRFKRGERFNGMFSPRGSGSEKASIVINSYGEGQRPRIDAGGIHIAGLLLRNVSYWEVSGLEITNTDGTEYDQGTLFGIYVEIIGKQGVFRHIYLNDCDIHDINGMVAGKGRGGIHVHVKHCHATRMDDLRITNNRIVRVGGVGIGNDSSCGYVELRPDRTVTGNLWTNVHVANNFVDQTGRNNIIARASKNAVYEYNTLANSSRYDTGHSIFCFNTDGIRIQHNEAYGNIGDEGMDRGGFDADYNCVDTVIQCNYSHDNNWFCGIMKKPNRNVVIRYNISQNEREGLYFYGFDTEFAAEKVHIYNNTHFTREGLDVRVFPQERTPLNTRFENNLFYFEGEGQWGLQAAGINMSYNNNLYFNLTPPKSDSRAIVSDPLFVGPGLAGTRINLLTMEPLLGYKLQTGSPAIDRGTLIEPQGELRDFFGRPVPGTAINIGAVE